MSAPKETEAQVFSETRISALPRGESCIISSRQAPQGIATRPPSATQTSLLISCSPLVIIFAMAFRSAHMPSEQAVSMQTPRKTFPPSVSSAAATPPASAKGESTRGRSARFARSYSS